MGGYYSSLLSVGALVWEWVPETVVFLVSGLHVLMVLFADAWMFDLMMWHVGGVFVIIITLFFFMTRPPTACIWV